MEAPGTVEELVINVAVGGQQGNQDTHLIPPHAYARGLNIITRNGHCQTRYGFQTRTFTNVDPLYDDLTEFQRGKFQGAAMYQSETSLWLMTMVSGRLYKLDVTAYTIECLSRRQDALGLAYSLNEYVDRCWFCQAERYFIVQDGLTQGLILDGDLLSWAHPTGTNTGEDWITVPIGTVMAFGHGRLFIKITPTSFLAGDIWKADAPEECLRFTETDYLAGGGAIGFPANLGTVVGMEFIKNVTTGDGMGELTVFGTYGVAGYQVQVARSDWDTIDLCKVLSTEHGGVAPEGIVSVNQDLCYQSPDGIRSLKLNMTEMSSLWYGMLGTRILSMDVQNYTRLETPWLQQFISGCQWDNRLLMTSGAKLLTAQNLAGQQVKDYGYTGMLVMDFMNVSEMDQKLKPTWDGMWAKYPICQVLSASYQGDRCFIISKNPEMQLVIQEIDKQASDDAGDPIYCQVASRGVTFTNAQQGMDDKIKRIKLVEAWMQDMEGDVQVAIYFKTDDYPVWLPVGQRSFSAANGGATYPSAPWMPQARARVSFQEAPFYIHPATGLLINKGYILELLITWSGKAKVEKIRLKAVVDTETPEDIVAETGIAVSTLIPQITDNGSALTDPSLLAEFVNQLNAFLTTPWDYPSTFEAPPVIVAQVGNNVAGIPLPTSLGPIPTAYLEGPQENLAALQYWRWVGRYEQ